MPRPRFSEMLAGRRRELGLSIEQASRILRLREDVLVAFEEGDFDRMPQSGYAQGMLSSYARYLGLNAREVVDLFQEELYEHVNGTSSHELRRRTRETQAGRGMRGYDVVNEAGSRPKAYVEYHGLLPTSGGPAGDMGNFATTTPPRPRRSVPLAGSGPSAAQSYGSGTYGSREQQRRPYNSASRTERAQASSQSARRAERQRRRNTQQRRRGDVSDPARRLLSSDMQGLEDDYGYPRGGYSSGERLYRRDDVSTRSVRPLEYSDDMRYDDRARPYESASTISGRRSSRNIASMERPNVRRRSGSDYGSTGRGSSARGRSGGWGGAVSEFFSDPRRSLLVIVVALSIVLVAILLFAVNSCVNGRTAPQAGGTVSVDAVDQGGGSDAQDDSSSSGQAQGQQGSQQGAATDGAATASGQQDGSAADAGTASGQDAAYVPTVVKVSLAAGEYSWLEITNDGVSEVAEGLTGPWEAEYTVTDTLSVMAGNPGAVTVTNNGANVAFTSKSSGMGQLSVKGTKPPETTDDGNATGGEGGQADSGDGDATDATQ